MAQITFTNTGGITSTGAIRGASVYSNNSPVLTGITKADVTGALGYTPATQDVVTTTKAGLVSATTGNAKKTWVTDANGNAAWDRSFDFQATKGGGNNVSRFIYFGSSSEPYYNASSADSITAGRACVSNDFRYNPDNGNLNVPQINLKQAVLISYNSTTEALEFNSV